MDKEVLYWGCMFLALALAIVYNVLIAKKFKIKIWVIVVCSLILFAFNWGISYINAFVEAGFVKPYTVNGVRAWIYAPLAFFAFSLMFKVDYKRLCDALTPCFILGFAFGKLGCVFEGCCKGIPYEGFGAVYHEGFKRFVFPVQLVEAIVAFIVFLAFVVYVVKSKYKVTGRQYPVMLIVYTGRFFFEYLRDNIKIWNGLSSLSFHALFGGLVGGIWLFFTTATGKLCLVKIRNFFRKIFHKKLIPVLTKEEYKKQIQDMQTLLNTSSKNDFSENQIVKFQEIENKELTDKVKNTKKKYYYTIGVSFIIFVLCVLHLILLRSEVMDIILVSFFAVFSFSLIVYSIIVLAILNSKLKIDSKNNPVIINKPDEEVVWLLYNNKAYLLHLNLSKDNNKKMILKQFMSEFDNKYLIKNKV